MTPEIMMVRTADIVSGNLWRCFPLINVDKVKDIPVDYPGPMAVPITIFDKLNREQFEVVDITHHHVLKNGRSPYRRIIIRHLHPDLPTEIDLAAWFRLMNVPIDVQFVASAEDIPEDAMLIYRRGKTDGQA